MYTPKYINQLINYQAGEKVKHLDYNSVLNLIIEALDHNSEHLFYILGSGDVTVKEAEHAIQADNATTLDNLAVSRWSQLPLQDSDYLIPTSKQVFRYVGDNNIVNATFVDDDLKFIKANGLEFYLPGATTLLQGPLGPEGPIGIQGPPGSPLKVMGTLASSAELPLIAEPGEAWLIDHEVWVWGQYLEDWINMGPLEGPVGPKGDVGDIGLTGPQGDPGVGIPVGGTTGQLLRKSSATDYDLGWEEDSFVECDDTTIKYIRKMTVSAYNNLTTKEDRTVYILVKD